VPSASRSKRAMLYQKIPIEAYRSHERIVTDPDVGQEEAGNGKKANTQFADHARWIKQHDDKFFNLV
jgi:hypothetical protein